MSDEVENVENVDKKRYRSGNGLGVRIVAAVLAFLMVLSVTATAISFLFVKA